MMMPRTYAMVASSLLYIGHPTAAAVDDGHKDQIAQFCQPMMTQTQEAVETGDISALNNLFENESFRATGRDELTWTISVGSLNQDIFVDNVMFPELRDAPGYTGIVDAVGNAFMLPLIDEFEGGAQVGLTEAVWPNTQDGMTTWIGFAQRTDVAGDTLEMICWVDSADL